MQHIISQQKYQNNLRENKINEYEEAIISLGFTFNRVENYTEAILSFKKLIEINEKKIEKKINSLWSN